MTHQKTWIAICAGVLTALLVAGVGIATVITRPVGATSAIADTAPSAPTSLTTHVLVVPAASFRSDGNIPDHPFYQFSGGYWQGNSTNTPCLMAPVYLPALGTIYEVWATVYDNDAAAGKDFWANLYRVDNYNGTVTVMAGLSTTGASTSLRGIYDSTIVGARVASPQYSYYLGTCLPSNSIRLYNVRIWYRAYKIYTPLLLKNS